MSALRITTICLCIGLTGNVIFGQNPNSKLSPTPAVPSTDGFEETPNRTGTSSLEPEYSGAQAASPEYASEPYSYEDPEEGNVFRRTWAGWQTKYMKSRRVPFQKYNHHPSDLQNRPIEPPFCSPTWGYYETCWRPFPAVPRCPQCTTLTGQIESMNPSSYAATTPRGSAPLAKYVAQQRP